MCTIRTNGSSKIIIKHINYKLNEQQYIKTVSLACCRAVKNGRLVRFHNPFGKKGQEGQHLASPEP